MEEKTDREGWVWVIVCEQQGSGHYLGLYNKKRDIEFIPAFPSKEAASDCFLTLPREPGKRYEIQAIHIEELTADAEANGFGVAMVDGRGNVVDA